MLWTMDDLARRIAIEQTSDRSCILKRKLGGRRLEKGEGRVGGKVTCQGSWGSAEWRKPTWIIHSRMSTTSDASGEVARAKTLAIPREAGAHESPSPILKHRCMLLTKWATWASRFDARTRHSTKKAWQDQTCVARNPRHSLARDTEPETGRPKEHMERAWQRCA